MNVNRSSHLKPNMKIYPDEENRSIKELTKFINFIVKNQINLNGKEIKQIWRL